MRAKLTLVRYYGLILSQADTESQGEEGTTPWRGVSLLPEGGALLPEGGQPQPSLVETMKHRPNTVRFP